MGSIVPAARGPKIQRQQTRKQVERPGYLTSAEQLWRAILVAEIRRRGAKAISGRICLELLRFSTHASALPATGIVSKGSP